MDLHQRVMRPAREIERFELKQVLATPSAASLHADLRHVYAHVYSQSCLCKATVGDIA